MKKEYQSFPRFLKDGKLYPAIKRAMLRWTIYKFLVRYRSKIEEKEALDMIKTTDQITEAEYRWMVERIKQVFNAEKEIWGFWKLRTSYNKV